MKVFRDAAQIAALLVFCSSCSLRYLAQGGEPSVDYRTCAAGDSTAETKEIIVVSLGWHTGILVSSKDVSDDLRGRISELTDYPAVEFGWGDAEFYESSGYSVLKGLKAAFFSAGSALHVAAFSVAERDDYLDGLEIVHLKISAAGFKKLEEYVTDHIELDELGKARALGKSLYGHGHFYAAKGATSLSHTCNSWISEALVEAGCNIQSRYIRASSLMRALRSLRHTFVPTS